MPVRAGNALTAAEPGDPGGRITWRRGYYYCAGCRRGRYQLDEALDTGPGQFSDGLQQGLCRLGTELPLGAAAESFTALTGVSVSPRAAERLTEGRAKPWDRAGAGVWVGFGLALVVLAGAALIVVMIVRRGRSRETQARLG